MISEIIVSPLYWSTFTFFILIFSWMLRAKFLDPNFLISLNFAQISAHILYLSFIKDVFYDLLLFNFVFILSFFLGWLYGHKVLMFSKSNYSTNVNYDSDKLYRFNKSLYILSVAFSFVLIFIMFKFGVHEFYILSDFDRISTAREMGIVRYLLWIQNVLVGIILLNFKENIILNSLLLFLLSIFSLFGGSKAGLLIIFLTFVAIKSWRKEKLNIIIYLILGFAIIFLPVFFIKERFYGLDILDIYLLLIFRIVGNSDALENLYVSMANLKDYPYSGLSQLIDPILKALKVGGFEYAPGVWLHGIAYNRWEGLGPNPTYIVEFYQANIFVTSYLISFLLGFLLAKILKYKGTSNYSVFILWIIYPSIFRDISYFWITFLISSFLIVLAYILFIKIEILRRLIAKK